MNSKTTGLTVIVESKNVLHNGLNHLNIQSEVSFSFRSDKHQNYNLKVKYHFLVMEHDRFGCFFLHPILEAISGFRGTKYDSHCFIFSAQTHVKQVSSTSNLGYIDHYISGSSNKNLIPIKKLSKSTSTSKLSVDF